MINLAITRQRMPHDYGTGQVTMAHNYKLARHFAMPAYYFLKV